MSKKSRRWDWEIPLFWFVIFPAIVVAELIAGYSFFEYMDWIDPMREFFVLDKPTLPG